MIKNIQNIQKLQECFELLFGDTYLENCVIEVEDKAKEVVLSVNREGILLLIEELITLCKTNKTGNHYHLDEAGMASKCNKPMVIALIEGD